MPLNKLTIPVLALPRFVKRLIVFMTDVFLCVLATSLAFYLRVGIWVPLFSHNEWLPVLAIQISIALALPIFIVYGLYKEVFRYSGWMAISSLLRACAVYGLLYAFVIVIIGVDGIPKTIGFIQPIVLLLLIGAVRGFASYWLSNEYRHQLKLANVPRVLIYGAGNAGRQLAGALAHSHEMHVVGFLDDDINKQGQNLAGYRVYDPRHLLSLATKLKINCVLLAIPSASRSRRNQILAVMRDAKLAVQTLPSLSDLAHGRVVTQDLRFLDIDDLLGRELVLPNSSLLKKNCYQKTILVTGAGGSIGSELCRQILQLAPKVIILVDQNEFALYQIEQELIKRMHNKHSFQTAIVPVLATVTNLSRMSVVVEKFQPDVIYHAAAYKHVPLVEENLVEGVRNNVIGSLVMAKVSSLFRVPNFILISTDKAVRPTNIMGASKRVSELIMQAFANESSGSCYSMVRFGNVLDSSGSVVPTFRQQIKDGGPVTITDKRVTRFFMTIPEASQLVIQSGALATGGDVFLLDMGEPVQIIDLAKRMIEMSGLEVKDLNNPSGDIEIKEIGLRPGEKLFEELLISGSPTPTMHPRIFKSHEDYLPWDLLEEKIIELEFAINCNDEESIIKILQTLVSGYEKKFARN